MIYFFLLLFYKERLVLRVVCLWFFSFSSFLLLSCMKYIPIYRGWEKRKGISWAWFMIVDSPRKDLICWPQTHNLVLQNQIVRIQATFSLTFWVAKRQFSKLRVEYFVRLKGGMFLFLYGDIWERERERGGGGWKGGIRFAIFWFIRENYE